MDAIANIKIKVSNEDILDEVADYLSDALDEEIEFDDNGKAEVEELEGEYIYCDDFVSLLNELSNNVEDLSITIKGTTDCDGNELQDFKVSCKNGKVKSQLSEWYCPIYYSEFKGCEDIKGYLSQNLNINIDNLDEDMLSTFKKKKKAYVLENNPSKLIFSIELKDN